MNNKSIIFFYEISVTQIWALWLFIALGTTADAYFVPGLTKIASQLRFSDSVAGVTLVAFGGGAPDIFAAVSAFTAPDPNVARLAVVNGLKINFQE